MLYSMFFLSDTSSVSPWCPSPYLLVKAFSAVSTRTGSLPTRMVLAPRLANASAMAKPMPRVAPVMSAVLCTNVMGVNKGVVAVKNLLDKVLISTIEGVVMQLLKACI